MKRNNKGGANATPNSTTKIHQGKDIDKVWEFFRYTTGTTLDCAIATGVLRNSITYYVADLENLNLLKAVHKAPDNTTGRIAKHYSANPEDWKHLHGYVQLELWGKEVRHDI